MLGQIKKTRSFQPLSLLVLGALIALLPVARHNANQSEHQFLFQFGYVAIMEIPAFIVVGATFWRPKLPNLSKIVWTISFVSLFLMPFCIFFVPDLFWEWGTIALYIGTCQFVYFRTRQKLGDFKAIVAAIGAFALASSLWELVYQFSYMTIYPQDFPQRAFGMNARLMLVKMFPLLFAGCFALWQQRYKSVRLWPWFWAFVLCLGLWYATGFPLELRLVSTQSSMTYYNTNIPIVARMPTLLTKVALTLAITMLFIPRVAARMPVGMSVPSGAKDFYLDR